MSTTGSVPDLRRQTQNNTELQVANENADEFADRQPRSTCAGGHTEAGAGAVGAVDRNLCLLVRLSVAGSE